MNLSETSPIPVVEGVSDADLAAETRALNKIKAVVNPPIDGQTFKMCGVDVVVPPLKTKHIVKFARDLQRLASFTSENAPEDGFAITVPIIHAALTRNYPNLSTADVLELLDISIMEQVILAVLGKSGYQFTPGEK